eukprot:c11248_g1_i1 orf=148-390(+)
MEETSSKEHKTHQAEPADKQRTTCSRMSAAIASSVEMKASHGCGKLNKAVTRRYQKTSKREGKVRNGEGGRASKNLQKGR